MNENNLNNAQVAQATPAGDREWKGLTLDEIRMKRAVALVKREVGRAQLAAKTDRLKTNVSDNGLRGLLFSKDTVVKLKTADYVLLGWRLVSALMKMRKKRK